MTALDVAGQGTEAPTARTRPGGLPTDAVSALAGALLATAFEPVALPYVVPLGIAGLSLTLRAATVSRGALRGGIFGAVFMLNTLVWLGPSVGVLPWVALSLVQALWFVLLGAGVVALRRLRAWPVWSAVLWSAVESLRGQWPFGGLPWSRAGTTVVDTLWAPMLPLLSIAGTSLVLALLGFVLAAVVETFGRSGPSGRRWGMLLMVLAALTLLPAMLAQPPDYSRTVRVGVVQSGVPGDGTDLVAHHREVTRSLGEATRRLAAQVRAGQQPEPDFLVWPENSTAVDPLTDPQARDTVESAVAAIGLPVLVGGMVDSPEPDRVLNQGIVWGPDGLAGRYTKRHPVPFGEYIPFRRALGSLSPRLAEVPRDMLPGAAAPPLDVAGVRVAMAICFDVAFDDVLPRQVADGAELVVVQTSNAMFTGTGQRAQQFAITRARAIETGRSVVVASTNGISGAIAPDGSVLRRSSTRDTETLLATVPLGDGVTPAVSIGRWLPWVTLALALGALATATRRRPTVSPT